MDLGKDVYTIILSKIDDLHTLYNFALVCKYFAKICQQQFSTLILRGFDIGEYDPTLDKYSCWEVRRNLKGNRHGLQRAWWPNGKLKYSIMCDDGEENGYSHCYTNDGTLQSQKLYVHGHCYDEKEFNDSTGDVQYWCEWEHGPMRKVPKLIIGNRVKWRR